MRASSSVSGLVVVVVLGLAGGCSPAEDPSVVAPLPESPAPEPAPAPPQATPEDLLRQVEQIASREARQEKRRR